MRFIIKKHFYRKYMKIAQSNNSEIVLTDLANEDIDFIIEMLEFYEFKRRRHGNENSSED